LCAEIEGTQFKALPHKRETILWLIPSEEQLVMYQKVLEKSEIIREAASKTKLGVEVFQAIGLLKRLCNHPLLVLPMQKPGAWREVLAEATDSLPEPAVPEDAVQVAEMAADEARLGAGGSQQQVADDARAGRAAELMARRLPRSADAMLAQSAKLRCMALLLPALAKRGHRTLVFSQSVRMLDLVQICVLKPHSLRCLRIDGQTDPATRAEKVAKFQEQRDRFQCMLLTTGVGGVGLNLTGADRVVMVDPAWNPAADAQAVDRAYRIGQDREVKVYRLVTSGLIEDKMFRLQVFKMGLTKAALENEKQTNLFTAKEIRALFEMTDPAEGETRLLLQHGGSTSEAAVREAADEDGAAEDGWLGDWLAAGASDFADFTRNYSSAEEAPADGVEKHVAETKQKLDSAAERTQKVAEAHKVVEEKRDTTKQNIAEAAAEIARHSTARIAAEEAIKEASSRLRTARSADRAAQVQLEKALKALQSAQEAQMKAESAKVLADQSAEGFMRSAENTRAVARVAEESLSKVAGEVHRLFHTSWHLDGRSKGEGVCGAVDVHFSRLGSAERAFNKVTASLDTTAIRQSEVEDFEDEYLAQCKGEAAIAAGGDAQMSGTERERARKQLEAAIPRMQKQAEKARENTTSAIASFIEAGMPFVEDFKKTQHRPVTNGEVKTAQSSVRSLFKQLSLAWTVSRQAQEAWAKVSASRSKHVNRLREAKAALAEASSRHREAQDEVAAATKAAHANSEEVTEAEAALAQAQEARVQAEVDETEWRQRRERLKAEYLMAKSELKPAKAAVKEAEAEAKTVRAEMAKVEKAQMKIETAKTKALERLQSEKYDAKQVEVAYELKRKGSAAAFASDLAEGDTSPGKVSPCKRRLVDENGAAAEAEESPKKRLRSKTRPARADVSGPDGDGGDSHASSPSQPLSAGKRPRLEERSEGAGA